MAAQISALTSIQVCHDGGLTVKAKLAARCVSDAPQGRLKWILERHGKVAAVIHWHLCHKFGFPCRSKNYEHFVDNTIAVLENEAVKLLWNFSLQTESKIEHNRPDIVVIEKKSKHVT